MKFYSYCTLKPREEDKSGEVPCKIFEPILFFHGILEKR